MSRLRRAFASASILGMVALLPAGTVAAPAVTPRFPDLQALPPLFPYVDRVTIDGTQRYVLRFTAQIWNAGDGPLELRAETDPASGRTVAFQRIDLDDGARTERLAGTFIYHPGHRHWHFERFADYELWTEAEYQQWLASGRTVGEPRWRGSKTTGQGESFCVRDSEPIDDLPGSPDVGVYLACDRAVQGISIGWSDTYGFYLPEQWVELGETLPPAGRYVLRVVADPANLLFESEGGADPGRESPAANEGVTAFTFDGTQTENVGEGDEPTGPPQDDLSGPRPVPVQVPTP